MKLHARQRPVAGAPAPPPTRTPHPRTCWHCTTNPHVSLAHHVREHEHRAPAAGADGQQLHIEHLGGGGPGRKTTAQVRSRLLTASALQERCACVSEAGMEPSTEPSTRVDGRVEKRCQSLSRSARWRTGYAYARVCMLDPARTFVATNPPCSALTGGSAPQLPQHAMVAYGHAVQATPPLPYAPTLPCPACPAHLALLGGEEGGGAHGGAQRGGHDDAPLAARLHRAYPQLEA